MCLIIFNWQPDSQQPLTLAANRDEFHQRPSLDAHFWEDQPAIFAGRDLEQKGTWLGLAKTEESKTFKLAALTNFRSADTTLYQYSRGEITQNFLTSGQSAIDYAKQINFEQYAGFNGLFFDGQALVYCHYQKDQMPEIFTLTSGLYGLSNAKLDSPWPKVKQAKNALTKLDKHKTNEDVANALLASLKDKTLAKDTDLPNTGVGIDMERMLSAAFIISPNYGTRTSSIVIIEGDNEKQAAYFKERHFSPKGRQTRELSKQLY
tara:strand:- start:2906 stop:3694 length:789 start_codon:yes stop_codon:yes gene_type:complete